MMAALPERLTANQIASLEDGLHIALCGAGGPMPAPNASGSCIAVVAGKHLFVVDSGSDGARNLLRMGYPLGEIKAVFLTHFHSDHIDGLGELATLRWVAGNQQTPLPVYGPKGVERVVSGFNEAYSQDFIYRHEHHGDLVAPLTSAGLRSMPFPNPGERALEVVYDHGGLLVEALQVDHFPVEPSVGYRFHYAGRSVLISGDTAKSENVKHFAKGVDLLVHDALAPNLVKMMQSTAEDLENASVAKIMFDIPDYHASPAEAAETARDSGVGHLLYYHIVPPLIIPGQESLFLNGAEKIFPDYTVGYDGVAFSLPANSKDIIQTSTGL